MQKDPNIGTAILEQEIGKKELEPTIFLKEELQTIE